MGFLVSGRQSPDENGKKHRQSARLGWEASEGEAAAPIVAAPAKAPSFLTAVTPWTGDRAGALFVPDAHTDAFLDLVRP